MTASSEIDLLTFAELGIVGFKAHKNNGDWQSISLELCDKWGDDGKIEIKVSRVSPGSTFQAALVKALSSMDRNHA